MSGNIVLSSDSFPGYGQPIPIGGDGHGHGEVVVTETPAIQWCLTLMWGCPVVECDFHPPTETLIAPTDAEEEAATARREAAIAEHAEVHTTAQFLRTIRELQERDEDDE